jgi:hypothetical protein
MSMSSSQRNWFPVIVAGLTILLASAFYAKYAATERDAGPQTPLDSSASPVTEEGYRSAVNAVMATYRESNDAQAAYDALIVLHVPSVFQQFHIDCIIALGKLASGDVADGNARLSALRAQYSWFTM